MNRILLLILIAGLTFLIVLFAVKPELLESVWLWLIGLSGAIVKAFQLLIEFFKNRFSGDNETSEKKDSEDSNQAMTESSVESFAGFTLKLLRYSNNNATTTGMLYFDNSYYCLTLEDSSNDTDERKKKRIPAGIYPIQYLKENTNLTLKYKERNPEWFIWHLQLKNVQGLGNVIIHNAGDFTGVNGLLVFSSLNIGNRKTFLSNSKETYRRLYEFISKKLDSNVPVRIIVYDENWIEKLN